MTRTFAALQVTIRAAFWRCMQAVQFLMGFSAPGLSSYLQGMVDANPKLGQFIPTGSQQFELMTQVTQSLTGRTGFAPAAVDIG